MFATNKPGGWEQSRLQFPCLCSGKNHWCSFLCLVGRQELTRCLGAGFAKRCRLQGQVLGLPHTHITALDLARPGFKRRSSLCFPQDDGWWLRRKKPVAKDDNDLRWGTPRRFPQTPAPQQTPSCHSLANGQVKWFAAAGVKPVQQSSHQ